MKVKEENEKVDLKHHLSLQQNRLFEVNLHNIVNTFLTKLLRKIHRRRIALFQNNDAEYG